MGWFANYWFAANWFANNHLAGQPDEQPQGVERPQAPFIANIGSWMRR